MREQGRVVHERYGTVAAGERLLEVGVRAKVVGGVVNGRVVPAAPRGGHAADLGAAGPVPALGPAVGDVVLVVGGEVGAECHPEVGVLVVVALDIEGGAAASALGHAIINKMLEGLFLASIGPSINVRIITQIIIGIKNSRVI